MSEDTTLLGSRRANPTTGSVTLELPYPPAEISPNSRVHYRKKARIVAQYREDCGWVGREWIGSGLLDRDFHPRRVEASVVFYVPDKRRRDEDNLLAMLKPAWDGLVDAGVLAGDDHERFSVKSVAVEVGKPARVEVTLKTGGSNEVVPVLL